MDEKQLKTSLWQRIIIIIVAILLLGSTVLTYMFIVMSGNASKQEAEERLAQLEAEYSAKSDELQTVAHDFGEKYLKDLQTYQKSQVKSFNAAKVNNQEKLQYADLKAGTGRQLKEGDTDYMAYYVGWCPDGSIFDSSFDYAADDTDKKTPTGLKVPLVKPTSLIEGWTQGVIGMKLGGVRQITIPGELAYGDTDQYCGMSNAPMKFVVMALEVDATLDQAYTAWNDARINLSMAYMGSGS